MSIAIRKALKHDMADILAMIQVVEWFEICGNSLFQKEIILSLVRLGCVNVQGAKVKTDNLSPACTTGEKTILCKHETHHISHRNVLGPQKRTHEENHLKCICIVSIWFFLPEKKNSNKSEQHKKT